MSEPLLIAQKTEIDGTVQCFLRPDKAITLQTISDIASFL